MTPEAKQAIELARSGLRPRAIAKRINWQIGSVYAALVAARKRGEDIPKFSSGGKPQTPTPAKTPSAEVLPVAPGWTDAKIERAVRLRQPVIDEVAKALNVKPADLWSLWQTGKVRGMRRASPSARDSKSPSARDSKSPSARDSKSPSARDSKSPSVRENKSRSVRSRRKGRNSAQRDGAGASGLPPRPSGAGRIPFAGKRDVAPVLMGDPPPGRSALEQVKDTPQAPISSIRAKPRKQAGDEAGA
jgi:hypothetical protein